MSNAGPRLLSLDAAAKYAGISYWTLRGLVHAGHLPAVRLPSARARDGRNARRILIDRQDLDRFIASCKECAR